MKRSNPTAGRRLISREQWKDPVKMQLRRVVSKLEGGSGVAEDVLLCHSAMLETW